MGRRCEMKSCDSSDYVLNKWMKEECLIHEWPHMFCGCAPPFTLYPFPNAISEYSLFREWVKIVVENDSSRPRAWFPNTLSTLCSKHFLAGEPTDKHPLPVCVSVEGEPEVYGQVDSKVIHASQDIQQIQALKLESVLVEELGDLSDSLPAKRRKIADSFDEEWQSAEVGCIKQCAAEFFGVKNELTQSQTDAMRSIMAGKNVLIEKNSKNGRSLCYQVPAMLRCLEKEPVLVVVPTDTQAADLTDFWSSIGSSARRIGRKQLTEVNPHSSLEFKVTTPDAVLGANITSLQEKFDPGLLVFDEFYSNPERETFSEALSKCFEVWKRFSPVQVVVLTCRLLPSERSELLQTLFKSKSVFVFRENAIKRNVYLNVVSYHAPRLLPGMSHWKTLAHKVVEISKHFESRKSIVVLSSLQDCHMLYKALQKCRDCRGLKLLLPEFRKPIIKEFKENRFQLLLTSSALCYNLDVDDVRNVIYVGMPRSPEVWIRLIGQAGGDQKQSQVAIIVDENCDSFRPACEGIVEKPDKVPEYCALMASVFCLYAGKCIRMHLLKYYGEAGCSIYPEQRCCSVCKFRRGVPTVNSSVEIRELLIAVKELAGTENKVSEEEVVCRVLCRTENSTSCWSSSSIRDSLDARVFIRQAIGLQFLTISFVETRLNVKTYLTLSRRGQNFLKGKCPDPLDLPRKVSLRRSRKDWLKQDVLGNLQLGETTVRSLMSAKTELFHDFKQLKLLGYNGHKGLIYIKNEQEAFEKSLEVKTAWDFLHLNCVSRFSPFVVRSIFGGENLKATFQRCPGVKLCPCFSCKLQLPVSSPALTCWYHRPQRLIHVECDGVFVVVEPDTKKDWRRWVGFIGVHKHQLRDDLESDTSMLMSGNQEEMALAVSTSGDFARKEPSPVTGGEGLLIKQEPAEIQEQNDLTGLSTTWAMATQLHYVEVKSEIPDGELEPEDSFLLLSPCARAAENIEMEDLKEFHHNGFVSPLFPVELMDHDYCADWRQFQKDHHKETVDTEGESERMDFSEDPLSGGRGINIHPDGETRLEAREDRTGDMERSEEQRTIRRSSRIGRTTMRMQERGSASENESEDNSEDDDWEPEV